MSEATEARNHLLSHLTEDTTKQYFALLRQCYLVSNTTMTKIQFEMALRKILTPEQVHLHNAYKAAIQRKVFLDGSNKTTSTYNGSKTSFEIANYTDYVNSPPDYTTQNNAPYLENKIAARELCLPDAGFMAMRIAIHVWENKLDGADAFIAGYLVQACEAFVKNIITAMVSRKEGYKIRDGKLQYGIGLAVPDPYLRNTCNIMDHTQHGNVDVVEDVLMPVGRVSAETAEQQRSFALSCAKRKRSDGKLSVQLLYDTLRENPKIVSLNSIHSLSVLKLGLQLEDKIDKIDK